MGINIPIFNYGEFATIKSHVGFNKFKINNRKLIK